MISKRILHRCVIIDVLTDVWVGEIIGASVGEFTINVWTGVVVGVLSGAYVDVIIDVESDTGVEVLTDVNASVLVTAVPVL